MPINTISVNGPFFIGPNNDKLVSPPVTLYRAANGTLTDVDNGGDALNVVYSSDNETQAVLDGTTGGEVEITANFNRKQIAIAGRTTGGVAVTAKSRGGEGFEPFDPPLVIDLTQGYTVITPESVLESLKFVPDASGPDFTVTIIQGPYEWVL